MKNEGSPPHNKYSTTLGVLITQRKQEKKTSKKYEKYRSYRGETLNKFTRNNFYSQIFIGEIRR